ncbi:hypothetical protein [Candidatus Aquicultor secundus]|uniref:Uncharacterized protein n=1 Tax=Candidatus Aquicultor secundus TaxID=1973895 RepID=A0A2M7T795_9ACTN|nr:hypothetical protein [Candidatus Aquicultor secundus]NCO65333.1 hypothetical protein [Solirubrobacter sp.]PIU27123.1 MAG: hypothetical protein COT10_05095 [Candidatus Aquicultor secundus]PIX52151.1 MAG: hypothetical protein COZ51_05715 [Candidatus Aquicultor secundus]PIZ37775.1 MAG: hypothetical protein COY37_06975 [Candidatus Aquicultor secundus]
MTHGGKMGYGHHMGGHRCRHGMGPGMGMMGEMGGMPMGMMGGPMGMMPMGMHGHGMCPVCGYGADMMGGMEHRRKDPMMMAKIAKKELLYEKIKAKMDKKYGDDLDKMADEIVNFAEEKRRMKIDYMKRAMEMRRRMWEFHTEGEEEEGEEQEE